MNKLGSITVGGGSPVRVMGILNASPESFYKSVRLAKSSIRDAARQMELDGADCIDVGGMSTAPYLPGLVPEKTEAERVLYAVNAVRSATGLPVSVDTCRASVAKAVLEAGVDIINDISGLKFDKKMRSVISRFTPSMVLCAYDTRAVRGDLIQSTKRMLKESVGIARDCGVQKNRLVLDPAIGFHRKSGKGRLFTRIKSDWAERDIQVIRSLRSIKQRHPALVSVSNKSFLGKILARDLPDERLFGSIAAEAASVLCGADIIRTHNVAQTRDAISVASRLSGRRV